MFMFWGEVCMDDTLRHETMGVPDSYTNKPAGAL